MSDAQHRNSTKPGSPPRRIQLPGGAGSLLERLRLRGYHLRADCAGEGKCGRCRVRLFNAPPQATSADLKWLTEPETASGWRLACQHSFPAPVELEHSPDWDLRFALEKSDSTFDSDCLGLAVDAGTTGLVIALVNLDSGQPVLVARGFNPQRAWGADVMTRLVAARDPSALVELQECLAQAINKAYDLLCEKVAPQTKITIRKSLLVGNSAMLHLAAGIPETTLSVFPFRSPLEAEPSFEAIFERRSIYLAGPIQGYVGSDHLGVLEYLALHKGASPPTLVMDLGTNSEIALWDGRKYWVTSCAAGPAFEGGGISCGSSAGPGVATRVQFRDDHWSLLPAQKKRKSGLCGSALISLLAQLTAADKLRADGKLLEGKEVQLQAGDPHLALTQKDVRALQLAKGAIRAGIILLARRANLPLQQLDQVIITGAFARDLKADDLVQIGLIPAAAQNVRFINDGALRGAARALTASGEPFGDLRKIIEVVNLVEEEDFQERFLEGLELRPMDHEASG